MKHTISYKTKTDAIAVGYNNFNIIQSVIPTGDYRKTCTLETLQNWIKTNHNLTVETNYDESQLYGYTLWKANGEKLTYIDNDSMFESENVALDEGLRRALYEIKCNS
jgi:hypothetical protein